MLPRDLSGGRAVPAAPPLALPAAVAPAHVLDGRSLKEITDAASRDAELLAIRAALAASNGNKAEAARLLRIDYKTLYVKLKQYPAE
jgi:two-component system nitrogen regulation response regulator GlnG